MQLKYKAGYLASPPTYQPRSATASLSGIQHINCWVLWLASQSDGLHLPLLMDSRSQPSTEAPPQGVESDTSAFLARPSSLHSYLPLQGTIQRLSLKACLKVGFWSTVSAFALISSCLAQVGLIPHEASICSKPCALEMMACRIWVGRRSRLVAT